VFATERGDPVTPDAINRLIKRIGERARFAFRCMPTCCGTLVVMRSPTPATTRGGYRIGSATDRSSTRRGTRN